MEHAEDVKLLCARKFFNDIRKLRLEMDCLNMQIEDLSEVMQPCTMDYSKDMIRTSPTNDQIPRAVETLEDIQQEYADKLAEYSIEVRHAKKIVDEISDGDIRTIMRCHFFDGMTFGRVADIVRLEERWVRRLCNRGLIEAYDGIPEEYKRALPNAEV